MPEIKPKETQLQEKPSQEKLEKRARNVLLFQLSRSMKTKWQLAQILEKREIPPEIAKPLLDRFEEVQLIDDSVFCRCLRSLQSRKRKIFKNYQQRIATKGRG